MNIEDKIDNKAFMTTVINVMASNDGFGLYYTKHCRERMLERNITTSDIIYVLTHGTIVDYQGKADHPTNDKIYKYKMVGDYAGNEDSIREIAIVILVEVDRFKNPVVKIQKILTTMWEDL